MGNNCCAKDLNDKYPTTEEEKRNMKKPFVAGTVPKAYLSPYSVSTLNLEKSTTGAHVDCPRTNLSATAPTKELPTNLLHLLPPKEKTTCVCARQPTINLIVMALIANLTSDLDPFPKSIIFTNSYSYHVSSIKPFYNFVFGLSIWIFKIVRFKFYFFLL